MDTRNSLLMTADDILLKLAKNEILHSDPLVKIAIFIKESLNVSQETQSNRAILKFAPFKVKIPVMLETAIEVYELMVNRKCSFSLACSAIAINRQIKDSTVRQACCSNLELSAENWNNFYESNYENFSEIKNALVRTYPGYESYIDRYIK